MRRGFDAFVGNPPFLGGKRVTTVLGEAYRDWLAETHEEASSNADLVSYFFRLAFERLAPGGAMGFVATNTIAQGDTRAAGLRFILRRGGVIFDATRRRAWPGAASVVVSVVHLRRSPQAPPIPYLDGAPVAHVSAFLYHTGGDEDPHRLRENASKAFIGCFLRGMGFTFDDESSAATPLAEAERLIRDHPPNAERIFWYLGGQEINTSPEQAPTRKVINFGQLSLEEARRYPALLAIVEAKVRKEREALGSSAVDRAHKKYWWRFANDRPELVAATRGLRRMIATARVSRTLAFAFVPTTIVPSDQLVLFAFEENAAFAVLQSRVHAHWARRFASSFGDGLRYTPSDCFETFPFPERYRDSRELEEVGGAYDQLRSAVMRRAGEGLTALYRRLAEGDGDCDLDPLRDAQTVLDRAVLGAYGWVDLADRVDDEGAVDELIGRLLALNEARFRSADASAR